MPNKASAFKALRQTKKRTARNTKVRSDVEALVRHVRKTAGSDAAKAREWLKQAVRSIDRATLNGPSPPFLAAFPHKNVACASLRSCAFGIPFALPP